LLNVVNCLSIEDRVFEGPSSLYTIGKVSADSYDASSFKESKFHWLSLSNGYLDKGSSNFLPKIIGKIGFPVISVPHDLVRVLKNSKHKDTFSFLSPSIIRTYLKCNRDRWENIISRDEVLQLFYYILKDKKFGELVGLKMIPLADGTLDTITTITQSGNSNVYIGPDEDTADHKNDERNIFKNHLNKFIDKSIDFGLYIRLYNSAKDGWNLNIKILDESAVADMIKLSLNFNVIENFDNEELQISDHRELIYQLWENFKYRNWDLTKFEEIHLIPTNRSTLRKLKTPQRIFSSRTSENYSIESLISVFEKFGVVFVENEFDISEVSKWDR
jgi:hypothetical protein